MKDYYKKGTHTSTRVSYSLYRGKRLVNSFIDAACYSSITAGFRGANKIVTFKHLNEIPYSIFDIRKFVKLMNLLNFPCEVQLKDEICYFTLDFKDYKTRPQILSGLYILRALHESYICGTANRFFKILDSKPKINKLLALQNAFKKGSNYGNEGHMVTYKDNGSNVTAKKLFHNFKQHRLSDIDGKGYCTVNECWNGNRSF